MKNSLHKPDMRMVPVHIYALVESDTGLVRYIGKTANADFRLYVHLSKAGTPAIRMWALELGDRGARVELKVIRTVEPGSDASEAERDELRKHDPAQLLNCAGGGRRKMWIRNSEDRDALRALAIRCSDSGLMARVLHWDRRPDSPRSQSSHTSFEPVPSARPHALNVWT